MTMLSNKEKLFLAGLQKAMRGFVAADIGKLARADLKAIEEAAGGKKKLADADRILADAKKTAAKLIDEVKAEGLRFSRAAMDGVATAKAALENTKHELTVSKDNLDAQVEAAKLKSLKLESVVLALQSRETAANDRAVHLDRKEKELVSREKQATEREAEIKRFDDWQATAPV